MLGCNSYPDFGGLVGVRSRYKSVLEIQLLPW
jgi:hypothetical protein